MEVKKKKTKKKNKKRKTKRKTYAKKKKKKKDNKMKMKETVCMNYRCYTSLKIQRCTIYWYHLWYQLKNLFVSCTLAQIILKNDTTA